MNIRKAALTDLEAITLVEATCFPAEEAASKESFQKRLNVFAEHFWLLEDGNKLVGFVNGLTTDKKWLTDDMYENAEVHDENGEWQMIFGLDVMPEYRCRGCAAMLMEHIIKVSKEQGRKGIVLTCKDKLIRYYEKFGFVNEGKSASVHGGAAWNDMRLTF